MREALTPTGTQSVALLRRRRIIAAALNGVTYALLLAWLANILDSGGWSAIDIAIFCCYAAAAPWSVLGVWNALIGVWLLHGTRNPFDRVAPFAAVDPQISIRFRTAILMTLRNESPGRAFARLKIVKDSLDATGDSRNFSYFVLSDTNDPEVAAAEEAAFQSWQRASPDDETHLFYRRRTLNTGFKAGNLRDFCARWGVDYEFMLPLDADSLMSGETILRLVRIAQSHPKLGILQSLVVGTPSNSPFARIFQFGMRHGMRPYTMGSAWWAGDCGPFWGHNALVRIAPFVEHCTLPLLPGKPPFGGPILSHDQVEAVLMRRGGFEARVLPEECGSYEDNPPTMLQFTQRDLRWCQGNLQYWRLLRLPGLMPMSRFQLIWAIMMFVGLPAWTLIIALTAFKPLDGEDVRLFPAASAEAFYIVSLIFYLAPKLAGFCDVALTRGGVARYGGSLRFAASVVVEVIFSFLLAATVTLRTSLFMFGLVFGRSIGWGGQARDAHALTFVTALRSLWPQLVFGVLVIGAAAALAPSLILWGLPMVLGYVVAAPFAVVTSSPELGVWLKRLGLCAIPEEINVPPEIAALNEAERRATLPQGGLGAARPVIEAAQ